METFPRYWPFVLGIHRSPVNFLREGQWRGALMFSLICAWINGWVNNGETGYLRRHRTNYDVIAMTNCQDCACGILQYNALGTTIKWNLRSNTKLKTPSVHTGNVTWKKSIAQSVSDMPVLQTNYPSKTLFLKIDYNSGDSGSGSILMAISDKQNKLWYHTFSVVAIYLHALLTGGIGCVNKN